MSGVSSRHNVTVRAGMEERARTHCGYTSSCGVPRCWCALLWLQGPAASSHTSVEAGGGSLMMVFILLIHSKLTELFKGKLVFFLNVCLNKHNRKNETRLFVMLRASSGAQLLRLPRFQWEIVYFPTSIY